MRRFNFCLILFFMVVLQPTTTVATDWFVSPTGSDNNNGESRDSPFQTIEKAFVECKNGDTIFVLEGIYPSKGNIGLRIKEGQLKDVDIENGDALGSAVLDLSDNAQQLPFLSTEKGAQGNIKIKGLFFQNAEATIFLLEGGTQFKLLLSRFSFSTGGVAEISAVEDVDIQATLFEQNSGKNGGVLSVTDFSNLSISSCVFSNNSAEENGGALFTQNGDTVTVQQTAFDGNTAENQGGAILVSSSSFSFEQCTLSNNQAMQGGAISVVQGDLILKNNTFTSNVAVLGGALFMDKETNPNVGGVNALDSNYFFSNEAIDDGDDDNNGDGGAVYLRNPTHFNILGVTFWNNQASFRGGALFVIGQGIISSCIFEINLAQRGGGLAVVNSFMFASIGNKYVNNNAPLGGGVYIVNQVAALFYTDTFYGNNAPQYGGGIFFDDVKLPTQVGLSSFINNYSPNGNHVSGSVFDIDNDLKFEVVEFTNCQFDLGLGPSDIFAEKSRFVFLKSCDLPRIELHENSKAFICNCEGTAQIYSLQTSNGEFYVDSDFQFSNLSGDWSASLISQIDNSFCVKGDNTTSLTFPTQITMETNGKTLSIQPNNDDNNLDLNWVNWTNYLGNLQIENEGVLVVGNGTFLNHGNLSIQEGSEIVVGDRLLNFYGGEITLVGSSSVAGDLVLMEGGRMKLEYETLPSSLNNTATLQNTLKIFSNVTLIISITESSTLPVDEVIALLAWEDVKGFFITFDMNTPIPPSTVPLLLYSEEGLFLVVEKESKPKSKKVEWALPFSLLVVGILGVGGYYLYSQRKKGIENVVGTGEGEKDSLL